MAKAKKESSVKKTPYTRKPKNKKPITKSEKIKNADLTGQLDNLMDDLTQHFQKKKKKPLTNESLMEDVRDNRKKVVIIF
jgi:hypothetical protein